MTPSPESLVDSHCHLDFPDFEDDLDAVLSRARAAGVETVQTISTRLSTFDRLRALARAHDRVYCSVGVHPHNVASEDAVALADLVAHAAAPEVIGIGETGLDYYYDHSPREAQRAAFRTHVAAARETGLPIIVHTRAADDDTIAILDDEMGKGAYTGLIHCFSTSRQLAECALELGLYISISGIITFAKAEALRETVRDLPLNRLLVETDAPFLAPVPHRGKRNEPAFVAETATRLAGIMNVDGTILARRTTASFFELFTKAVEE